MRIKSRYKTSKSARIGDTCYCPSCHTEFIKEHWQQAFCKTKGKTVCKDKYWNTVTPHKRNNTTRISPASRVWSAKVIAENSTYGVHSVYDGFHPFEGLNDEDYKHH